MCVGALTTIIQLLNVLFFVHTYIADRALVLRVCELAVTVTTFTIRPNCLQGRFDAVTSARPAPRAAVIGNMAMIGRQVVQSHAAS